MDMDHQAELIATGVAGLLLVTSTAVPETGMTFNPDEIEVTGTSITVVPLDGRAPLDIDLTAEGGTLKETIASQLEQKAVQTPSAAVTEKNNPEL